MTSQAAWLAAAAALACAVAVVGCGFGAGPSSSGTATLIVTRGYGSELLVEARDEDPPSSETVIRFLDAEADITTRYGGGFVQSINGLSGTASSDWFFYVNGVESSVGSADVHVAGGDRIWWDYRNWSAAMSVPAVVGAWPEPFAQASLSKPEPVVVQCADVHPACEVARSRLAAAGVDTRMATKGPLAKSELRLLVGTWPKVRRDPTVDEFRGAPASDGVFATLKGSIHGTWHLIGLDMGGDPSRDFGSTTGLVAGSGGSAVRRAAAALDAGSLRNHYAVAATGHGAVPLPIVGKAAR